MMMVLRLFFFLSIFSSCSAASNKQLNISTVRFDEQTYPVVILGGGMAGLTAAVYCSQANIPCLVIEGPKPGGALSGSHSVRNWPGIEQAPGADIVGNLRKQALAGGVKIVNQKVTGVNLGQWPRTIQTQDLHDSSKSNCFKALTVIIAMGTEPNYLGVPGEKENWGKGVSNCAVCEGSLYKNKNVAIVGGGDAAITEADYLADIAKKVTILVRKDFFRAKDIKAKEKVLARPNVEVRYNTEVKKVVSDGSKITHLIMHNNQTKKQSKLSVDGLFLAIGSRPNTALFKNQLELDRNGFIVLKKNQETSINGIFAGGDVSDYEFVQAVTASSDGCKSALQAIKLLKDVGFDKTMLIQKETKTRQPKAGSVAAKPLQSKTEKAPVHKVPEIMAEKDFDRLVMSSSKPVVLDIFTTWCMPCQAMMPIIGQLADAFTEKIVFAKINASSKTVDVDKMVNKLKGKAIQSVPAFLFIKNGKEVDRLEGTASFEDFKKKITTTFKIN